MPAVRRERVDVMSAREEQTLCTPFVHVVEVEGLNTYWTRCGRYFLRIGKNPRFVKAVKEMPTIRISEPWKAVETDEPTTCIECLGRAPAARQPRSRRQ